MYYFRLLAVDDVDGVVLVVRVVYFFAVAGLYYYDYHLVGHWLEQLLLFLQIKRTRETKMFIM